MDIDHKDADENPSQRETIDFIKWIKDAGTLPKNWRDDEENYYKHAILNHKLEQIKKINRIKSAIYDPRYQKGLGVSKEELEELGLHYRKLMEFGDTLLDNQTPTREEIHKLIKEAYLEYKLLPIINTLSDEYKLYNLE